MSKLTTREMRIKNRLEILHIIYREESITRLDICQFSELSPATITNVVADLIIEGLVLESGLEDSKGGRPRSTLIINPAFGCFIGVEMAELHLEFELFDFQLHFIDSYKLNLLHEYNQPDQIVACFVEGLKKLLKKAQITQDKIIGIGVGVPGLVEEKSGLSIFAPNWGWHNIQLKKMLQEKINIPLYLDNSGFAHVMAESWFGFGKGLDSMVSLILGTGVGAGIINNGNLYRGFSNSAGEWGHTNIVLNGRLCHCGSHGCIEAYTGAPGIIQTLRELTPDSKLIQPNDQVGTIQNLGQAALQNDPTARMVLSNTAQYLGGGIANIINLINPQLIVLGGWVSMLIGTAILPELNQAVRDYSLERPFNATKILLSPLQKNSVSMGSAVLALEYYLAGTKA
jgi:predicted NBD/HSP70 family sugar kinase